MAGRFPMPNTPRDIEEEERLRKIEEKRDRAIPPFKSFPIGEDPSEVLTDSYFPFPSAGPMPEDGMAKVKEALMQKRGLSSPGPASLPKGKPMSLKGDFEDAPRPGEKSPEFIGGDGGFSETPVGRTTNLPSENPSTETLVRPDEPNEAPLPNRNPEGSANPSGLAPGSGAEDKERRAREYIEQRMIRGEPTGIPFSDLLMRSAAQFGTLNGKHADTQPYSDFAKSLQGEENANEDRRLKIAEYLAKKNQARSSALKDDTFNREKLAADERRWNADREMNKKRFENESRKLDLYYQNMLNQAKNQGEVNEINKAYRQAMADIASQNATSLGSLRNAQVSKIEGEAPIRKKELELKDKELGLKERDLALKEKAPPVSKLSEGKKKYVADLEGKTAAQTANLNLIRSYLDQFNRATTDQDKARIAGMMAKPLNGLAGQDAVGVEEVNRIMEATKQIHLGRALDGKNPFGRDLDGFRRQVEAVLRTAEETVGRNTKEIESITSGGGIGDTIESRPSPSPSRSGANNYESMSIEELEELARKRGIK